MSQDNEGAVSPSGKEQSADMALDSGSDSDNY